MLATIRSRPTQLIQKVATMLVQRLSFRAAIGQLRVIPVWQALRRNGARIYRWSTNVDRWTNTETMTVDIVGSGPLRMDDLSLIHI